MKKSRIICLFCLICAFVLSSVLFLSCAKPQNKEIENETTIVDGKNTKYVLVLPEESGEWLDFAAEEFNVLIKGVSNMELNIIRDGDSLPESIENFISIKSFDHDSNSCDFKLKSSYNNQCYFETFFLLLLKKK